MIIRDNTAKSGDAHKESEVRNTGEELNLDLGRPMTEEEEKIFAKLKEGLGL